MTDTGRESLDERLGANLRMLRKRAGMSQNALAAEMKERGYPWHQETVVRIESGRQQVKFAELFMLAKLLDTTMDRLAVATEAARAEEAVWSAGARLRQRYEIVAEAAADLLAGLDATARILAQHEGSAHARVRDAREDVAARMRMYGLDEAVAEGVSRHEERGPKSETVPRG